jgi:hypothetical protein
MPGVVNPGRPDSDIDVIRGALTQEGAERTTRCSGSGSDEPASKALTQVTRRMFRTDASDAWRHLKVEVGTLRGRSDGR